MAGSTTWLKWLAGLFSSLKPAPAPGTHESYLEELRVGGLLDKERRKPPGQRDEELVHALRVDYHRRQLKNRQVRACRRRVGGGSVLQAEGWRCRVGAVRSPHQKQRACTPLSCIDELHA